MPTQQSWFPDCSKHTSDHHCELPCRPAVSAARCAWPWLIRLQVVVLVSWFPHFFHPIQCWQSLARHRRCPYPCVTLRHQLIDPIDEVVATDISSTWLRFNCVFCQKSTGDLSLLPSYTVIDSLTQHENLALQKLFLMQCTVTSIQGAC